MSNPRSVLVGQRDSERLEGLLRNLKYEENRLLFDELDSSTVVADHLLPSDVVTMNTMVTFADLDTQAESTVLLTYPHEVGKSANAVSILAPVGAALLGLRVGETIEWPLPNGKLRKLKVISLSRHA
ncbi:MAG: nucleoside diphosphate kinase regulator [Halioglobus sp.]|nr:nucleoside diphosphate kinase regulator [Halioglobus sp.]